MPARRKSRAEIEALGNSGNHSKADLAKRAAAPLPIADMIEAVAANPIGDAPDYLSANAKKAWVLAAPSLQAVQLLMAPDRIAFGRYCGWLAEFFDLDRKPKGKVVTTTKSRAVKMDRLDRGFQARLMLDKRLLEYEDRFGMNPDARNAIFARLASGFAPTAKQSGPGPKAGDAPTKTPTGPVGFLKTSAEPPRRLQ